MDYDGIGRALAIMMWTMISLIVVFVPLGLWKLIEIVIWLFRNVHIEIG